MGIVVMRTGEEGSLENLVGLDVGDRPLFVQVSKRAESSNVAFRPVKTIGREALIP